jgi:hypothetical protein
MKEEWSDWQDAWRAGKRSLPDIQARARHQKKRMVLGFVGVWVIGAFLVAKGILGYASHPRLHTGAQALFHIVFSASILGVLHGMMWGRWREATTTPTAVVVLMQQRWTVRRRLSALVRGGVVFAGAFALGLAGWEAYEQRNATPFLRSIGIVVGLFVFVWLITARLRAKIDREIAALEEAKRLLETGES